MDLIAGRATPQEVITYTRDKKMAMVGMGNVSMEDLFAFEEAAAWEKLKDLLITLSEGFSYVFIDCPAGVGPVTRAALSVATGVIVPVNAKNTTAKSIPLFLRLVEKIREGDNPDLVFEGLVVTMLDYANSHEIKIRRDLMESLPKGVLFNSFIIHNAKYEEASLKGVPIAMTHDGQDAARGYMNLAMELLSRQAERDSSEDDHVEELF